MSDEDIVRGLNLFGTSSGNIFDRTCYEQNSQTKVLSGGLSLSVRLRPISTLRSLNMHPHYRLPSCQCAAPARYQLINVACCSWFPVLSISFHFIPESPPVIPKIQFNFSTISQNFYPSFRSIKLQEHSLDSAGIILAAGTDAPSLPAEPKYPRF